MKTNRSDPLFRVDGTAVHDPAVDAWFVQRRDVLGAMAQMWFQAMRGCGDEVREVLHDGCPAACFGDAPFGYVDVFTTHGNVGFYRGAGLPDPAGLLEGDGKRMRHVKLRPHLAVNEAALRALIAAAYAEIKNRVEHG
jgi:hypothetical protein